MKIMHTMESEVLAPTPKRRLYRAELKSQVVTQVRLPGASVARVALSHGINANIVHRWLREREGQAQMAPSGFVAVSLPTGNGKLGDEPAQPGQDIRIEVRRGATVVNIAWPVAQAGECSAWMRELLR